jgi:DNA-binding CsgD family transcriptional regulator
LSDDGKNSRDDEGPIVTIALAIDDSRLAERVAAALSGIDDVRLVSRNDEADVVLVTSKDAPQDARTDSRSTEDIGSEHSPASSLTPREREVLALLAEGASNKTIAGRLGISVHTAKFHVASLLDKLDATGRTDAVVHAARLGVIEV